VKFAGIIKIIGVHLNIWLQYHVDYSATVRLIMLMHKVNGIAHETVMSGCQLR